MKEVLGLGLAELTRVVNVITLDFDLVVIHS